MLEAKKSAWFEKVFAVYNRNLIKRRFHSIQVSGLDFLRDKDAKIPLIIYANHSSWWDGLAAFEIFRKAKLDAFCMMEEKHLKKLFLFRRLGAFSIVRENGRQAVKSINYAADLLKKTGGTLLIFPQGEIVSNDARPIKFYMGLSRIIEKIGKVYTVSMAMRYEFLGEFKPQIFVKIASSELIMTDKNFIAKEKTNVFAERITMNLDKLKSDIVNKNFNVFEKII
ncbi:MAG: lysophospholipid acyltransferase family protein [Acidobacteriota bacterium]|nr:lysophospholipid acyltransferase family protein [Acidobacteriota bacterium]